MYNYSMYRSPATNKNKGPELKSDYVFERTYDNSSVLIVVYNHTFPMMYFFQKIPANCQSMYTNSKIIAKHWYPVALCSPEASVAFMPRGMYLSKRKHRACTCKQRQSWFVLFWFQTLWNSHNFGKEVHQCEGVIVGYQYWQKERFDLFMFVKIKFMHNQAVIPH